MNSLRGLTLCAVLLVLAGLLSLPLTGMLRTIGEHFATAVAR